MFQVALHALITFICVWLDKRVKFCRMLRLRDRNMCAFIVTLKTTRIMYFLANVRHQSEFYFLNTSSTWFSVRNSVFLEFKWANKLVLPAIVILMVNCFLCKFLVNFWFGNVPHNWFCHNQLINAENVFRSIQFHWIDVKQWKLIQIPTHSWA